MALVDEARKVPLPVTMETLMSFGISAKDQLTAAATTASDVKEKLEAFNAGDKWARNFIPVSRNQMTSIVLHGEAGSVDDEAIAKGLEEIPCDD